MDANARSMIQLSLRLSGTGLPTVHSTLPWKADRQRRYEFQKYKLTSKLKRDSKQTKFAKRSINCNIYIWMNVLKGVGKMKQINAFMWLTYALARLRYCFIYVRNLMSENGNDPVLINLSVKSKEFYGWSILR